MAGGLTFPDCADWGAYAVGPDGEVLLEHEPDRVLSIASVGKLLLLLAAARAIDEGDLDPAEPLRRTPADEVADSGLWQDLGVDVLPAADVAALIGAHSDNLATNVLLRRLGLDTVPRLEHTALHDYVRDARGPDHPPRLASGTARELAGLFAGEHAAARRGLAGPQRRPLDGPLRPPPRPAGPRRPAAQQDRHRRGRPRRRRPRSRPRAAAIAYAVIANWSVASFHRHKGSDPLGRVMEAMRAVGLALNESSRLSGDSS